MKFKKIYLTLVLPTLLHPVTIVYNMRVASINRRQRLDVTTEHPSFIGGTLFRQWREAGTSTKETTLGSLGTYIYATESHYFKVDAAIAHVINTVDNLKISRTQTDDLLFTGGYGHIIGKWRFAYSGLFGVPTHRDFILELAQFGTGHFGTGIQTDFSYRYSDYYNGTIFGAARFIHFFPRTVEVKNPLLQPLFESSRYKLKLGNLVDLFISHQISWKTDNRFECGYDATFGFSNDIQPVIADFAGSISFIRHSFFGAYFRHVSINKTDTGIVAGLSYGFDSKPKLLGNTYFITLWGLWGVIF
jgi:hypothetical protein